jgi:hypothetical protein
MECGARRRMSAGETHRTEKSVNNPTATFVFDMRAAPQYAPPVYPAYHQEAPICYQPVGLPAKDLLFPRLR